MAKLSGKPIRKIPMMFGIFISGCATHATTDALFSQNFQEVKRSTSQDAGGCAFANREYDAALVSELGSPKSSISDWRYDWVDGRRAGLDVYLTSKDLRQIHIAVTLQDDRCTEFEAYWVVE